MARQISSFQKLKNLTTLEIPTDNNSSTGDANNASKSNGGGGHQQDAYNVQVDPKSQTVFDTAPKKWSLRNLPDRIAAKTARQDFRAVCSALSLVPLKFVAKTDEEKFYRHVVKASDVRTKLASLIGAIMFLGYWIITGTATLLQIYPYGKSQSNLITFHLSMAFIFVGLGLLRYSTRIQFFTKYLELWIYVSCFIVLFSPQLWIIYVTTEFPSGDATDVVNIQEFKLWTAPFTLGIYLWNVVVLNLFLQTSFFPQLFFLFLLLTFDIIQAVIFTSKQTDDSIVFVNEDSFNILVSTLECTSLLLVFLICYFGRWNLELQERIEFWKLLKSEDQLKELRESSSKKKKKTVSTAVEDLLDIIMRAVSRVQEVEVTTGHKLLVESTEILRQIQAILTNTDNLYAVNVQSETKGATINDEEITADMEAQFYEIYANQRTSANRGVVHKQQQQQLDSKKSRPFGEHVKLPSAENVRQTGNVRSLAPQPRGSAEFRRGVGRDWSCNILQVGGRQIRAAAEYPNIMVEVGSLLLEPRSADLGTSPIKIRNYVHRIECLYRCNPYHNPAHAAMVAHSMCCLLKMLKVSDSPGFSSLDAVAVVIAALGHDAGHPGRNNQFFINAFQKIALLWNDKSVLENFHSALVFRSLEPKSCNIMHLMDRETVKGIRKKIIDLILATDMSQHFESILKFKLRRQAIGFDFLTNSDDMWHVVRMSIKCADLSHAVVHWPQHQEWSLRVIEEFYQQGEEEASMGLPISPLCDRNQHADFPKSQKGFIEFVVQPLFTQMGELDSTDTISGSCLEHLTFNKYKWESLSKEDRTIDIPEVIGALKTESASSQLLLMHLLVPYGYKPLDSKVPTEIIGKPSTLQKQSTLENRGERLGEVQEDGMTTNEEMEQNSEQEDQAITTLGQGITELRQPEDYGILTPPEEEDFTERSTRFSTATFGGESLEDEIDFDQEYPDEYQSDRDDVEKSQNSQFWDDDEDLSDDGSTSKAENREKSEESSESYGTDDNASASLPSVRSPGKRMTYQEFERLLESRLRY